MNDHYIPQEYGSLKPRTVSDVIVSLQRSISQRLIAPLYVPKDDYKTEGVFFAVESMKRHTSDEGWQIAEGLESNGYTLAGHNLEIPSTNIGEVICNLDPEVVVLQDKREWDVQPGNFREPNARFHQVIHLLGEISRFKLTVLKDAHQQPEYHRQSAYEMGCHAWLSYYHPRIVSHLAPYVRPHHLIRVYHTLDRYKVPAYTPGKYGTLISGAISGAYPLRQRIIKASIPGVVYQKHPGYHRNGCETPEFLKKLNYFKVVICTSSMYGYALRKLIEASACGCRVITDLPSDEFLPFVDKNLVRVHPEIKIGELQELIKELEATYDPSFQEVVADEVTGYYDFRQQGNRTARDIHELQHQYV